MKRHEALRGAIGLILLLSGWILLAHNEISVHQSAIETRGCHMPVTILDPPHGSAEGSAIVFHGLSSNRRMMQPISEQLAATGLRVYIPDLPGHGDNSEAFSPARAENCGRNLVLELIHREEIEPSRTILVGHSMGGAIAIRLADNVPAAATIAISPAPMVSLGKLPSEFLLFPLPYRLPDNLLVLFGGLEGSLPVEAGKVLLGKTQKSELRVLPWATHAGLLFDSRVMDASADWAKRSLHLHNLQDAKPRSPLLGETAGLVGLLLIFPALASILKRILRVSGGDPEGEGPPATRVILHVLVASAGAVLLLQVWVPLRFLHILTGDYLASFLLIAGVYLLAVFRRAVPNIKAGAGTSAFFAGLLAIAIFLGIGAWLDWRLVGAWMNGARWLRFVPLTLLCFPYFLAEETLLGPPAHSKRLRRFLIFTSVRCLEWLILGAAVLWLHSNQILIILLVVFLVFFSILQRLGMDSVRRRTGSAAAAAIFGDILAAGFLAAVLPLT